MTFKVTGAVLTYSVYCGCRLLIGAGGCMTWTYCPKHQVDYSPVKWYKKLWRILWR